MSAPGSQRRQLGLTYIEVLIAATLIIIALIPAMNALNTGLLGSQVHETRSDEHYAVLSKMESVLAEPFSSLLSAAQTAGDWKVATTLSDASGPPVRRIVYVALYDADDADKDGNTFTVPDPDVDGDGNPYTSYDGVLWVRVEAEGSVTALETLVYR